MTVPLVPCRHRDTGAEVVIAATALRYFPDFEPVEAADRERYGYDNRAESPPAETLPGGDQPSSDDPAGEQPTPDDPPARKSKPASRRGQEQVKE